VAAQRVQEAWQTIPHIVQMVDVDALRMIEHRLVQRTSVPDITLNDVLVQVAAHALVEVPELNVSLAGDALMPRHGVDVGVAVETTRGLMVPVIRGVDRLTLSDLVSERARLVKATQTRGLPARDTGNASFTVSNLGMYGIRAGTPLINLRHVDI
jgi:pyruvate/2-oxoglutarate dehydrogenase complex dihydrolipoamide acyltransferase (E2) component